MNEKQQAQLIKLLEATQGGAVQPDELIRVAKTIITIIKDVKTETDNRIANIENGSVKAYKEFSQNIDVKLNKLSNNQAIFNEIKKVSLSLSREISRVESLIPTIDFSPIEKRINAAIADLESRIPKLPEELKAEKIRDKLESLKGNDRLDKSAIKGLEDEIKRLEGEITNNHNSPRGGIPRKVQWDQKNLTGDIDGINTVFTFASPESIKYSERVFLNYVEQNPLTDYTIIGKTVTYTTAPDASLSGLPHIIRYAF